MTTPQPDPTNDQPTPAEDAVIAALVAWFASRDAVSATLLPARLVTRLTDLGLSREAVRAAGRLTMEPSLTGRGRYGSPAKRDVITTAARDVKADEPLMRARYLLAAAKRLSAALVNGVFPQALRVEATYLAQHTAAGRNRVRAANALDQVAAKAGPDGKLRWVARMDPDTTPDCAALNGTIFTLDHLPHGQIPGAVHPRCRCTAVVATDMFAAQPVIYSTP